MYRKRRCIVCHTAFQWSIIARVIAFSLSCYAQRYAEQDTTAYQWVTDAPEDLSCYRTSSGISSCSLLFFLCFRLGGIKRWCASDVCLTSVCLTSVAYIGPKSRTERPRKTKIGTEVAHVARDSDTTFKVKRSKGQRSRSRARWGILWRPPHGLFERVMLFRRLRRFGYINRTNSVHDLLHHSDTELFSEVPRYYHLLPPPRTNLHRGHFSAAWLLFYIAS